MDLEVQGLLMRKERLLRNRERIAKLASSTSPSQPKRFVRKLTPLQLRVRKPKLLPLRK